MIVLGLDLSLSSTGIAALKKDKDIKILLARKIVTFKEGFETEDDRINFIVDRISEYISFLKKEYGIDCIAIENQFMARSTPSIMCLRKLLGATIRMCYKEHNINVLYYAPTTVKKTITSSGKASKEDVALGIQNLFPELKETIGKYSDKAGNKKTSDIYDAVGIAYTCISFLK